MRGRLILDTDEKRQRAEAHGIRDHRRVYGTEDMAAGDVLFAFSAPELYELLVMRRGWSLPAYAEFVRRGLVAELLED
jgi:hypothetical protein